MATEDKKDVIEDDDDHGPQQGTPRVDNGEFSDLAYDPQRKLKIVGTNPIKPDGVDKVTGRAKFGADTHLPGTLVGKVLRSPHAWLASNAGTIISDQGVSGIVSQRFGGVSEDDRLMGWACEAREKM